MKRDKKNDELDKVSKRIEAASLIVAIIALGISIFSLWQSQKVVEYQIEQERLPRIIGLNQTLDLQLLKDEEGKIDFERLSDEVYPIKIPIYNVGVGIAQNCKVEWDEKSLIESCGKLEKLLEEKLDVARYSWDNWDEEAISFYQYDYLIEMDKEKPESVVHYVKGEYAHDFIACEIFQVPFMLPITENKEEEYICLSKGMSTLLLEAMQQDVKTPVSLNLKVTYQDLAGKEYSEDFFVTFSLAERMEGDVENKVSIDVMFVSDSDFR